MILLVMARISHVMLTTYNYGITCHPVAYVCNELHEGVTWYTQNIIHC